MSKEIVVNRGQVPLSPVQIGNEAPFVFPSHHLPSLRRRLLNWFGRQARPLPWRQTRDPYVIWVSEIMLQQTQVATVIPFFERFLQAFPDIASLARAEEQEVLRLWAGLGYYRRARALHQAACLVQNEHGGRVPADAESLSRLPGLGRYTVNAVLSQAFDQRLPILEANSRRVLCRLLGCTADPRQGWVDKLLWQVAEKLLPRRRVGQFNQALMEVGALLCTPISPRCSSCPLSPNCAARKWNLQDRIPPPAASPRIEPVDEVALVIRRRHEVLLVQRPAGGRWAGMWEFPHHALQKNETHTQGARRLLSTLGMKARLRCELMTIRHAVTRFRITMVCLEASHQAGRFREDFYRQALWLPPEEVRHYPVSSPQRRIAQALLEPSTHE